MSAVSRLSYISEFISPTVRVIIDGLPFTSEGYSRAKNILISKYGKSSEVAYVRIQNIMSLPYINSVNLYKIHEFKQKLLGSLQALETIGKPQEINGYLRLTLDNLQRIRTDLVKMNNGWQEWKFPQLVEIFESWTRRTPITLRENIIQKSFKANQFKVECIYCDQSVHKSADCEQLKSV